jgi:protein TonB
VRLTNPFFLSVSIHLSLVALVIGALNVVQKTIPIPPEKISLKILMNTPDAVPPAPLVPQHSKPIQQPIAPSPEPKQPQIAKPLITQVLVPSKPIITAPQPMPPPVSVPKAVEPTPIAPPKISPPPKVEENYAEENLGRIRTILSERLKYPKNALRLKQQGESTITFTLGTNREVSQITITQSSGFELLDDAAKELIEISASEFPKPKKAVRISVPIAYKLR